MAGKRAGSTAGGVGVDDWSVVVGIMVSAGLGVVMAVIVKVCIGLVLSVLERSASESRSNRLVPATLSAVVSIDLSLWSTRLWLTSQRASR